MSFSSLETTKDGIGIFKMFLVCWASYNNYPLVLQCTQSITSHQWMLNEWYSHYLSIFNNSMPNDLSSQTNLWEYNDNKTVLQLYLKEDAPSHILKITMFSIFVFLVEGLSSLFQVQNYHVASFRCLKDSIRVSSWWQRRLNNKQFWEGISSTLPMISINCF